MCRPDGEDAVASAFDFVAPMSCWSVRSTGILGGGVPFLYFIALIRSCTSLGVSLGGEYVPLRIASLYLDGSHGGMVRESGLTVKGVLSVPGPLISVIAWAASLRKISLESVTSSHASLPSGVSIRVSGSVAFG